MIEFKDGKNMVAVSRAHAECAVVKVDDGIVITNIFLTKETYALLQQAMPIIGDIVEGE